MKCYLWGLVPPSNISTLLRNITDQFFHTTGYKNPLPPHIPLYCSKSPLKEFKLTDLGPWPQLFTLSGYSDYTYPMVTLDQADQLDIIKKNLGKKGDYFSPAPKEYKVPGVLPLPLTPEIEIPEHRKWPQWTPQNWKSVELVEWRLEFSKPEVWFSKLEWQTLRSYKRRLDRLNTLS